jgi:imidazolonepropionase-like amidohydrolase
MTSRRALRVPSAVLALAGAALVLPTAAEAQFTEPPPPAAYALRNVTIVRGDGSTDAGQTIVVRANRIEVIGRNAAIPGDARVLAGDSLYVYPGLIDAAGTLKFEQPRDTTNRSQVRSWAPPRATQGFLPSRRVLDYMTPTGADGAELRKKGVVALAVHPPLGEPLMPGRGALILLRRDATTTQELVIQPTLAPLMTLRGGRGVYPNTGMAVLSWYRQAFLDAQRQLQLNANASGPGPSSFDGDMAILQDVLRTQGRVYIVANTADEIRRALDLAAEFNLKPVIVGGTEAWKVAADLRTRNVPVLVNVDFTKPRRWKPDEKPAEGEAPKPLEPAAAREKKQLEDAYANAGRLAQAGVTFALVSGARADLREGARKAVEYGLSESDALRALTITPAILLDVPQLARVQTGGTATFLVADAPLLSKESRILYTFVEGSLEPGADQRRRTNGEGAADSAAVNAAGTWRVEFASAEAPMREMTLQLTQEGTTVGGTMQSSQGEVSLNGSVEGSELRLSGTFAAGGQSIPMEVVGTISGDEMSGAVKTSFGDLEFTARRSGGRS